MRSISAEIVETRIQVIENRRHGDAVRNAVLARMDAQESNIDALRTELVELSRWQRALPRWDHDRDRLLEILRLIYYDEPRLRAKLRQVRAAEAYRLAYEDSEPLISVVMRTYDNYRMLAERSIPSVLEQTYQNFEIIVTGDDAPPEAEAAVRSFSDERIRYHNLNRRGPYPSDAKLMWFVAGVPPYNESLRTARGRWLAPLDDDDAFRPCHLETLLELVRRKKAELAYGKLLRHMPDGSSFEIGEFPPRYGQFGFQGALFHAELRFFELELADALFGIADDWGGIDRMLRTGVRMTMLDDVVTDYYPASEFSPRRFIESPAPASSDPSSSTLSA